MKKIFLIIFALSTLNMFSQAPVRYTGGGNTATTIKTGSTSIRFIGAKNNSSDTVKVALYNYSVTPTYTTAVTYPFDMLPHQTVAIPMYGPWVYKYGAYFRVTKGGTTGKADTYTVQPSVAPDVIIGQ